MSWKASFQVFCNPIQAIATGGRVNAMPGRKFNMLKANVQLKEKSGLQYMVDHDSRVKKFKPWLGDMFSFLYDRMMEKTVFPKKFQGSLQQHYEILSKELGSVRGRTILEIGTGTGNAVHFLHPDNHYTGVDISPGLLKRAVKNFNHHSFQYAAFHRGQF